MREFPANETTRIRLRATVPLIFSTSGFIRLEQFLKLNPFAVVFMLILILRQVSSLESLAYKNIFCSLSFLYSTIDNIKVPLYFNCKKITGNWDK